MTKNQAMIDAHVRSLEAAEYMLESSEKDPVKISEKFGIARKSLDRAKKVISDAIPEVIEAIKAGRITLTKANEIAFLTTSQQKEMLENVLYGNRYSAAYVRSKQFKHKELNKERIDQILTYVERLRACCKLDFVSPYNILLVVKELESYCNSLKGK